MALRDTLTLAIFDIESLNNPLEVGGWDKHDKIGFALGVVKWVAYRRDPKTHETTRWTICENVHLSATAFLDDLLRPWADVIVGWNALAFDIPVAVAAAVPAVPGPYVKTSDPATVLAITQTMHRVQSGGYPLVAFDGPVDFSRPTTWWQRVKTDLARRYFLGLVGRQSAKDEIGAWMKLQAEHSSLIPAGVTALTGSRAKRTLELSQRCFDPLAVLDQQTGIEHVARLDYAREGLESKPYLVDGLPVDHARLPAMFRENNPWQVADICRDDVLILEELIHQALMGRKPRLMFDRLNGPKDKLSAFENKAVRARWRYHIPTTGWWERLQEIAEQQRFRIAMTDTMRRAR